MGVHLEEEACVEINFNQRKKKHMENKKINGFNFEKKFSGFNFGKRERTRVSDPWREREKHLNLLY